MTKLNDLYNDYGQSPWIDNIRLDWVKDGTLERLVSEGVRGVTSNPSIFAKTLSTSSAYDELVVECGDIDPEMVFEKLAVNDVRLACDALSEVHKASVADFAAGVRRYADGFCSLEVSPRLARDTVATVAAAKRLAGEVGRDNVMIKIPATKEGLPAITEVLATGINVNITLIFSLERYGEVITAWMEGLETALAQRGHINAIASVASFFVSRVDVAVDPLLPEDDPRRGTTANAQVAGAYELYRRRMASDRARALLDAGAQVQRPLWASTSTKNPSYFDLLYVDAIVADETVNTMPDATLAATLDHGNFATSTLLTDEGIRAAAAKLDELPENVSLEQVTAKLEVDGVAAFSSAYDDLLVTVEKKMHDAPPT
ncbi:MAG TPA: transaldolase [Acidimicrobiales bacterium]